MRIRSLTPITVTYPLGREPMSFCFVRVETDTGLIGYGEACDSYGCSYAGVLAEVIDQVYAPLLVLTVSVPYVPTSVDTPAATVPPVMP